MKLVRRVQFGDRLLVEILLPIGGLPQIDFELSYDPISVDRTRDYEPDVEIVDRGRPLFEPIAIYRVQLDRDEPRIDVRKRRS